MTDEEKYGKNVWICEDCGWFIYPSALKLQETLGNQTYPWHCIGCFGRLKEKPDE